MDHNSAGFVYVLSNPCYKKNVFKIGKTQNAVYKRIEKLSSDTGVPAPFVVEYYAHFDDCHKAERLAHSQLHNYRIANNREFFDVDLVIIVREIESIESCTRLFASSSSQEESASTTKSIADEVKAEELESIDTKKLIVDEVRESESFDAHLREMQQKKTKAIYDEVYQKTIR